MPEFFFVSKRNGVLGFRGLKGWQSRKPSTAASILVADSMYEWPDFPEMRISMEDYEDDNDEYTFSKRHSTRRTVPDFIFDAWPESRILDYDVVVSAMQDNGSAPATYHRVGWIGNTSTHPSRVELLAFHDGDVFDLFDLNWDTPTDYISLPDLTKRYSVLLDIEGHGYSGRLKLLFWSQRPVLMVERPHQEFFFEHLKPWVHYVPVKSDLSDLKEKAKWCLTNYDEAQGIAQNALDFARTHLTRDACYARWDALIREHIAEAGWDKHRVRYWWNRVVRKVKAVVCW